MKMLETWNKIKNDDQIIEFLFDLKFRWLDEKEYEDFKDYEETMKKKIPNFIKGIKRPFGLVLKCDDGNIKITTHTKGNSCFLKAERG